MTGSAVPACGAAEPLPGLPIMEHHADLYEILGVSRKASPAEIAHAYRLLLRRHHPDTRESTGRSPSTASDEALQQVLAAYAVLGDAERRADYDKRTLDRQHHRAPDRPQSRESPHRPESQVPIRAGPVRWHR